MSLCPCCSDLPFDRCCGPVLSGDVKAATPERVMRARYTAYAQANLDYLRVTLAPESRDEFDADSARTWSESAVWEGLEIVACEAGGVGDDTGTVEFIARYTVDGEARKHHEIAQFVKCDGEWFFADGQIVAPRPYVREAPKLGRNDPCACGSGRKFKKCCGK